MNFYVEFISPKDLSRLTAFDALFIRQSTEVNNEAYAFARKAQQEDIAIMDYPDAILKCCNKVFMAEALENAGIPTPKLLLYIRTTETGNRKNGFTSCPKIARFYFFLRCKKSHDRENMKSGNRNAKKV